MSINPFRVPFRGLFIHQDAVQDVQQVVDALVPDAEKVEIFVHKHALVMVLWVDESGNILKEHITEFDGTEMACSDAIRAMKTLLELPTTVETMDDTVVPFDLA